MKRNLIAISALLIFTLSFTVACKKESNLSEPRSKQNNAMLMGEDEPECEFVFSESRLEFIGTEHNRLIQSVFESYMHNPELSLQSALNNTFEENGYDAVTEEEYAVYAEQYSPDNVQGTVEYILDTLPNDAQKEIFNAMINAVLDNTGDYNAMLDQLNALKESARTNLTCYEQLSTLVALEVCINSARLWLPLDAGGEGYLNYISTGEAGRAATTARTAGFWSFLGKLIISDAIGAFGGFVQAAGPYLLQGGAANPIANATLAFGTVRGAVQSSATTAVVSSIH